VRLQKIEGQWLTEPLPPSQAHYGKYEPTILELKRKYEGTMKEKTLANLERDKMAAKVCSAGAVAALGSWEAGSNTLAASVEIHRPTPMCLPLIRRMTWKSVCVCCSRGMPPPVPLQAAAPAQAAAAPAAAAAKARRR
jgi:hypothetical protein